MMKWYEKNGEHNDIVLSSRIRLARNVVDFPFNAKMTPEQRMQFNTMVREALEKLQIGENKLHCIDIDRLSEIRRYAMVEHHTISRELIEHPQNRMLVLSEDESIAIMVNEEDHLRIQVIVNGLNLNDAYDLCNKIDDVLDETLHYAFDEKLGYLTSCPTNLGTGMRASVMMHLPALEKSGLISRLTGTIGKLGLTIRGTYGEGSSVLGSFYQISNQITLGITEQDSIQNLESVVLQIIESENQARQNLAQNKQQLEDAIFRSLGTLRYARLLSGKDFFELSSNVRLGVSLGLVKDVEFKVLNELINQVGTASVCDAAGKELTPNERDYERAKIVRAQLSCTEDKK